jgi:hypothetical protein
VATPTATIGSSIIFQRDLPTSHTRTHMNLSHKKNPVAWVRERTIPPIILENLNLLYVKRKNSARTSQETHHVSATETNRLKLLRAGGGESWLL